MNIFWKNLRFILAFLVINLLLSLDRLARTVRRRLFSALRFSSSVEFTAFISSANKFIIFLWCSSFLVFNRSENTFKILSWSAFHHWDFLVRQLSCLCSKINFWLYPLVAIFILTTIKFLITYFIFMTPMVLISWVQDKWSTRIKC